MLAGGANNRLAIATGLFVGSGNVANTGVFQLGDTAGASDQTVSSLSSVVGVRSADITILDAGSGFTSEPILSVGAIGSLEGAQGAQFAATITNGIISGITILDGGSYRPGFAQTVTVAGGGGAGASILVRALGTVTSGGIVGGQTTAERTRKHMITSNLHMRQLRDHIIATEPIEIAAYDLGITPDSLRGHIFRHPQGVS